MDEMTLALMYLTSFDLGSTPRSWKGYDRETMNRLHAAGLIGDPVSKAKSVALSDAGMKRSRELFETFFSKPS